MSTYKSYLEAARERVLIYDGATGTNLQLRELNAQDFGGDSLEAIHGATMVTSRRRCC